MTTFYTNDGVQFEAKDDFEVVHKLREMSFTESKSDAAFMAEVADRVRIQTGDLIPVESVQEFVAALIKVGFLKESGE